MTDFVAFPSRRRIALLALGSLAFVAIGCWIAGAFGKPPQSNRYSPTVLNLIAWTCMVFFGVAALVWIGKLFDTREQLRIGTAGLRFAGWSDQTIPWSEITNVTTWTLNRRKMIVLHLRHPSRFPGRGLAARMARANRMLTGGDVAISLAGMDRDFADALAAIADFQSTAATTGTATFGRRFAR